MARDDTRDVRVFCETDHPACRMVYAHAVDGFLCPLCPRTTTQQAVEYALPPEMRMPANRSLMVEFLDAVADVTFGPENRIDVRFRRPSHG